MANYAYNIASGKFNAPGGGTTVPPFFVFGDTAEFELAFQSGVLEEGDVLTLAIDSDMEFYDPFSATGDASVMAFVHHQVAAGELTQLALSVPLATEVFRQRVNGRLVPLRVYVGLYLLRGSSYSELALMNGFARPVVAGPEVVSPVLPTDTYPTREEALQYVAAAKQHADDAEAAAGVAATARNEAVVAMNGARAAETAANTAKDGAVTAQGRAELAKTGAETARDAAINAKDEAKTARNDANAAKEGAITAKNAAEVAKGGAESARDAANEAKNEAVRHTGIAADKSAEATAASNVAKGARDAAVSAKDEAKTARNDANAAKDAAVSAKNSAVEAKNGSESARDESVEAKNAAVAARNEAVTAKDEIVGSVDEANEAKDAAIEAKEGAEAALKSLDNRLSASYIYGFDWTDANLLANEAGQCVVLNNLYDNAQYNASLRYMQVQAHGVLPAHNFRRCVCSSARNVAYYTHPSNSRLKADGVTPSVLTGADGDFNVELDITYYRVDTYTDADGVEHTVWLVSDKPFNGSQPNRYFYVSPDGKTLRKQYVGACRSCVCDADGNTLNNNKTATTDTTYQADKTYYSRLNNVFTALRAGTDYTVGDTITQGSTVDTKIYQKTVVSSPTGYANGRKYRSLAGALPAASATREQFRSGHNNNGYDSVNFLFASYIGMMMAIEYGSFNIQSKFSPGYTNLQSPFDYKSMRLTGRTDVFGNNSGEIVADDADSEGEDYDLLTMKSGATIWTSAAQNDHSQRIVQCSYRGIEDPFGSQWCNDEGIQKNQDALDLSITYGGNVYLRDEQDDPETINLYGWLNGTTKFYTTSAEPEAGLNLYANTGMTTVTGVVVSAEADFSAITVGTKVYTRSAVNDTTGHSYAWKNGDDIIYSHVVNPHTDANTREVFSDAQLTQKLGNVTAVEDDYSESGYWCTQATSKYSMLDTDRGRLKGDEYVFPSTGYTGDTIVWVHHEWQKGSWFPSKFDPHTFYGIRRTGNYGSATKGLCDQAYNDAGAGPRLALRFGPTTHGSTAGPFFVNATNGLAHSYPTIGSRPAA